MSCRLDTVAPRRLEARCSIVADHLLGIRAVGTDHQSMLAPVMFEVKNMATRRMSLAARMSNLVESLVDTVSMEVC